MWAYQARYRVPLNKAVAGNWVLLEGVDATSESMPRLAPKTRTAHLHLGAPILFGRHSP